MAISLAPLKVGHIDRPNRNIASPPTAGPQDQRGCDLHSTTLTESELAAIHHLLQADSGLFAATGASEMLVTYPSQSQLHEALKDNVTPEEFENDGDERN